MGISLLDNLADREKNKTPVLDSLAGREKPIDDTGFFSYIANLAINIPHLVAANSYNNNDPAMNWISDRLYRNAPEERAQIKVIQNQLKQANLQGGDAWNQTVEDLRPKNFFSKLNSKIEGIGSVGDIIAGLPRSLAGMAAAPFEAASGIGLGGKETTVLSPEERADKIKESAALILSAGAGAVVKAGGSALLGSSIPADLTTASDVALATAAKSATGGLARKAILGASEGLAAGSTFGGVSRANREDQLTNMLVAVPFAAIGAGMEMLGVDKINKVGEKARDTFALRQLQYSPNKALVDIAKDIENISTAKDLTQAAVKSKVDNNEPYTIIPNADVSSIKEVLNDNYSLVRRKNIDGNYDALVFHKDVDESIPIEFMKSGYLPKEIISQNGKDLILNGKEAIDPVNGSKHNLDNPVRLPEMDRQDFSNVRLPSTQDLSSLVPKGNPGISILNPKDQIVKIAARDANGRGIGLLTISKTGEKTADVFTVFVDPAHRRQGLASKLYDTAEKAGYTLKSGQSGLTKEGKAFVEDRVSKQVELAGQELANQATNVLDTNKFVDNLYKDFTNQDALDPQPKAWLDTVDSYLRKVGVADKALPSLRREFLNRAHEETLAALPENEKVIYKQAVNDTDAQKFADRFQKLKENTHANNMYFDTHDAGVIVLRDKGSNKELLRTQNIEEAEKFISQSGQERGIDLDGNRIDPPIFPAKPDNLPSPNEIPELHKAGRLEQFISWLDTSTEWATASRAWANATDVTYGTSLQARIHDPLQVAVRQAHTQARPWLERLKNEVEKHVIDLSKDDRAKVSNYLETMTPDQILQNGIGGRKLNDLEIQAAKQFSNVDVTNLFKFRRRIGEIQKQFKRNNPQRKVLYEQAKQEFGIGSKELDAFKTMSAMRKMPLENASIGNSVRLARALQDEKAGIVLDRDLYAAKYMSASQLAAAKAAERLNADLATKFGIPNDKMLPNYFTHARLYNGGEISDVLKLFKSNKAADDFYASLVRTGEIDAYERDPIIAARRYILAGFNHLTLTPAINSAAKALKEELIKIPDASRSKAERVINQYMSDLRGMPTVADNFTQNAFDTFTKKIGLNFNTNIRREWINAILSTVTGATQGFRVVQGLRDFYSNTRNTYSRLGVQRTARALELGSNKELRAAYLRDGIIQGYGVLQFATPLEQELGVVGRGAKKIDEGLNRFNQAGMKLSGQPSVFELFQTGVYAEARESSARISRDIVAGKFGKLDDKTTYSKAYKSIELDAFDRSTQLQYDKLMQSGEYEKAADFLGRQSVAEIIGMYGNANHPTGWNRNIGRIAGQFGMWPTNYRHFVGRLASQGEVGMRAKRLARTAVMDLGLTAVAAKTGISFFTWTALPSIAWMGGPSVDAVRTIYDATVGYGTDQSLAQSRLKSILPYNSDSDTWNLKHLYIPGSFFADDLAKAYDLAVNQNSPGMGAAKGIGMKVEGDNYEAGAIEEFLGEQMGH